LGAVLKVALAVLTAIGACQKVPVQSAPGVTPLPAPPAMASVSGAAASAPALAANPPVAIERDAGAEAAAPTASISASEVTFEGTRLTVGVVGDRCVLTFKGGDAVRLDLAPPCYVLVWNEPPPRLTYASPESDGQPVGAKGEAMAWKYPSAHDAKVLAVIGDSIPERLRGDSVLKIRQAKGYRCAGSLQGVKVVKGGPVPTAKWGQGNIYCVETGIDEKDYWMLGHDK